MRCSRASLVDKSLLCQARQLLFLRVDDLTQACQGGALVGRLEEEPNLSPNTGTNEFSLRESRQILRHNQRARGGLSDLEHDPEKWKLVFSPGKREAFARRSCSKQ